MQVRRKLPLKEGIASHGSEQLGRVIVTDFHIYVDSLSLCCCTHIMTLSLSFVEQQEGVHAGIPSSMDAYQGNAGFSSFSVQQGQAPAVSKPVTPSAAAATSLAPATASQPLYSGQSYGTQGNTATSQPAFASYNQGVSTQQQQGINESSSQPYSSLGFQSANTQCYSNYQAPSASQPVFSATQQSSYQPPAGNSGVTQQAQAAAQQQQQQLSYNQYSQYGQSAASQYTQQYDAPVASTSSSTATTAASAPKPVVRAQSNFIVPKWTSCVCELVCILTFSQQGMCRCWNPCYHLLSSLIRILLLLIRILLELSLTHCSADASIFCILSGCHL